MGTLPTLPKKSATVNSCLIEAGSVDQLNPQFKFWVRLVFFGQLFEGVLVDEIPPDVNVNLFALAREVNDVSLVLVTILGHKAMEDEDPLLECYGVGQFPQNGGEANLFGTEGGSLLPLVGLRSSPGQAALLHQQQLRLSQSSGRNGINTYEGIQLLKFTLPMLLMKLHIPDL